jgi:hypothetical protein
VICEWDLNEGKFTDHGVLELNMLASVVFEVIKAFVLRGSG